VFRLILYSGFGRPPRQPNRAYIVLASAKSAFEGDQLVSGSDAIDDPGTPVLVFSRR
jgi:hypothetical protein